MMRLRAVLLCAGVAAAGVAAAEGAPEGFEFMPDGGRAALAEVFGTGAEAEAVLSESADVDGWLERIEAAAPDLEEVRARTLAGYLAINAPVPADAGGLPPDGRDLAVAHCQSCHSLFTGYLVQRRDEAGWLSTFLSPFHQAIDMTEAEKATFADYSALNMPMPIGEVPPELRF